jgi:hypothetical protein
MTHPPGWRILMANDAVAGIDGYRAFVFSLGVNAHNGAAQPRRCAMQRAAS